MAEGLRDKSDMRCKWNNKIFIPGFCPFIKYYTILIFRAKLSPQSCNFMVIYMDEELTFLKVEPLGKPHGYLFRQCTFPVRN